MSTPDFIIIGAMKCGTSTLAAQLSEQAAVTISDPKEPCFFSDDVVWERGLDWYESLFDQADPQDLKGEASTHYTKLPDYPAALERLARTLPDVRLIYVIRNPLDRAVSHFVHSWSQGEMEKNISDAFAKHPELVNYGLYGMQLTPYVERFGVDRIHLMSLESMKTDPHGTLQSVGAFLGADRPFEWKDYLGAQNVSAERTKSLPLQSLLIDNPVATALRRTLVPKSLRKKIRDARTIGRRPELPEKIRLQLISQFSQDRDTLAKLFPGHSALEEAYPFVSK